MDFFHVDLHLQGLSPKKHLQRTGWSPVGWCQPLFLRDLGDRNGMHLRLEMLFRLSLLLLSVMLFPACSTLQGIPFQMTDQNLHYIWPPKPNQPRIKLLRVLKGPEDVVPPSGRFQRLFETLTGERGQVMGFVAPAGVVADGERFIYVADPSARQVDRYD